MLQMNFIASFLKMATMPKYVGDKELKNAVKLCVCWRYQRFNETKYME
jgi:hypothetical protein